MSTSNPDTKIAVMANDLKHVKDAVDNNSESLKELGSEIKEFKDYLDRHFVTQNEFKPVKWFIVTLLGGLVAFLFAVSRSVI